MDSNRRPNPTPSPIGQSVHAPRHPFGEGRRLCLQSLGRPPRTMPVHDVRVTSACGRGEDDDLLTLLSDVPFRKRVSMVKEWMRKGLAAEASANEQMETQ